MAVCKTVLPFVQSIPPTAYRTPTVDLRGLVRELCIARRRSGSRWYFNASMINSWHSTSCLNSTLFSTWSARNYNLTTSHKHCAFITQNSTTEFAYNYRPFYTLHMLLKLHQFQKCTTVKKTMWKTSTNVLMDPGRVCTTIVTVAVTTVAHTHSAQQL